MDGITAGYYHDQEQYFTNAMPQNHQYTDAAASHQDYHLPNSSAPVSVVSGGQVMELHYGVSSSLITPSVNRFLEDPDPEEASGYMGKYTCPHLDCPFSNYSHGFNSRAKRNRHMVVCLYGNGVVYQHVPADGQMPSAPYINEVVEEFIRRVTARNRNNKNSVEGPAVEPAPLRSLNTTVTAPAGQVSPSIYPQSVEPGIIKLPEHPIQSIAFENNNNNNGILSTYYGEASEAANNNQPPEVTMTTAQDGFQQSAATGIFVGNTFNGINFTGTQESQQNVTFGTMEAASFGDEDWLLDYPPSTWKF